MLKAAQFKTEIFCPIRDQFIKGQTLANAYCLIWAIDAYATHMAFDGKDTPKNVSTVETKFKDAVTKKSYQFRIIREASNATKHAIRRQQAKEPDVKRSSDIKPDENMGWRAYWSNVDGGVTIDVNWKYNKSEKAFFDSNYNKVEGFNGVFPEVYLSNLVDDAIKAIEDEASPASLN